jgi:hypothetical protein
MNGWATSNTSISIQSANEVGDNHSCYEMIEIAWWSDSINVSSETKGEET